MAKWRKKPVIVEADVYQPGMEDGFVERKPYINTLEGRHFISPGDYIITGIKGERYPCKPDIFHATYEPVNEEDQPSGIPCAECGRELVIGERNVSIVDGAHVCVKCCLDSCLKDCRNCRNIELTPEYAREYHRKKISGS